MLTAGTAINKTYASRAYSTSSHGNGGAVVGVEVFQLMVTVVVIVVFPAALTTVYAILKSQYAWKLRKFNAFQVRIQDLVGGIFRGKNRV